jgi:hypothetical protein
MHCSEHSRDAELWAVGVGTTQQSIGAKWVVARDTQQRWFWIVLELTQAQILVH